jgi:hypothetical protein
MSVELTELFWARFHCWTFSDHFCISQSDFFRSVLQGCDLLHVGHECRWACRCDNSTQTGDDRIPDAQEQRAVSLRPTGTSPRETPSRETGSRRKPPEGSKSKPEVNSEPTNRLNRTYSRFGLPTAKSPEEWSPGERHILEGALEVYAMHMAGVWAEWSILLAITGRSDVRWA